MKKKNIIFGSLLAVFLMLMMPNIGAIEYQTVTNANELNLIQEFQNWKLNTNARRDKIKNVNMKELREAVQNVDIDRLKEEGIMKIKNSDLIEKQKDFENIKTKVVQYNILMKLIAFIELSFSVVLSLTISFIFILLWLSFILPSINEVVALLIFFLGCFIPIGINWGMCKIVQRQLGWTDDKTDEIYGLLIKISGFIAIFLGIIGYLHDFYDHNVFSIFPSEQS